MSNLFLQRRLPNALPWDSDKHRHWHEVHTLGRSHYALRRMALRFTGIDLARTLGVAIGFPLTIALLAHLEDGFGSFAPRDLLEIFVVAPWFLPLLLVVIAGTGFIEGWMRWGLYAQIAASHAGPPYVLERLVADTRGLVALLNVRIPGGGQDQVLCWDGHAWRTRFRNDREDRLIDLLACPDGRLLVTRFGGDLLTLSPDGEARVCATRMEGGYLAALADNTYLIAGTPTAHWYVSGEELLRPVDARTTERPAIHRGRAYLIDAAGQHIAIISQADVTRIPLPAGAQVAALAVTSDGTIYAAGRSGAGQSVGRVIRWTGEAWQPIRVPFEGPVRELAWEGANVLALSEEGLYRYDPSSEIWEYEYEAGVRWRFAQLAEGLVIVDGDSGGVRSRRGGMWREGSVTVPLDGSA